MDTIRLAIVDDHPMILEGLQNMFATLPGMQLDGTYSDTEALLLGLKINLPDVLLLDIQLTGQSGDEVLPQVIELYPDVKVVVYTQEHNVLYVYNMLKMGAYGYVVKTSAPRVLISAIQSAYNGSEYIDPVLQCVYNDFVSKMKKQSYLKLHLTQREKEILQLITDGLSSQEIADTLFISIRTVEYYRLNILLKLDVKNTAMLVKKAVNMGLVK